MDSRQVHVYVHKPEEARLWSCTVTMAVDAADAETQRRLRDGGFEFSGDSAFLEVVGEDEEKMYRVLIEVVQWINGWAKGQGVELAFNWKVRRQSRW